MAREVSNQRTQSYLIKFARGGRPLDHGFDKRGWTEGPPAPGRVNFYPGKTTDDPNQGTLYIAMIKEFRAGIEKLRMDGHTPVFKGFLWMQGEADTRRVEAARRYAANLRRLIRRVREDVGAPEMPAAFGRVLPQEAPRLANRKAGILEIHRQMAAADMGSGLNDAIGRTRMVETKDFELLSDKVHFSSNGLLKLGSAFSDAIDEASRSGQRFEIWGQNVPGFPDDFQHQAPDRYNPEHLSELTRAYLTYFPARKTDASGPSVIVFPGGGYRVLADLKEGDRVAQFLADQGFQAFVLRYRVSRKQSTKPFQFPGPLYDARRALAFVKQNSTEFQLDPEKIGVVGFSAGGHLASMAATRFNDALPGELEGQEKVRPAFAGLIYPVATMIGEGRHRGSAQALFGKSPKEEELVAASPEKRVTQDSPPLFIVHNEFDPVSAIPSLKLALAAQAAKADCELHIYPSKTHGFGMGSVNDSDRTEPARIWPQLFVRFLKRL